MAPMLRVKCSEASIPLDTLRINATPMLNPFQLQTNLVKWGTPTLIPNTDEASPTLKLLFVV